MDWDPAVIMPMLIENLSSLVFVLGAASAAVVAVARAFPFWPDGWLNRKPLSCPTCMSLWSALATVTTFTAVHRPFSATLAGIVTFFLVWGAAMGVCLFLSTMSGLFASADSLFSSLEGVSVQQESPKRAVSDSPPP